MGKLLPLASVEKLARRAGAERITKDAIRALAGLLESYAEKIAEGSTKYARYAKRATIKREDIELSASE